MQARTNARTGRDLVEDNGRVAAIEGAGLGCEHGQPRDVVVVNKCHHVKDV